MSEEEQNPNEEQKKKPADVEDIDRATVRFAGDSGDGMQITGTRFTTTSALIGNDVSTLPDFPAEIRAPAGSLAGVSGFQVNFSSREIHTPGDEPGVLVAMNPAALKVNIGDLEEGGILIVNTDSFDKINLERAGYTSDPLSDGSLAKYRLFKVPITTLTERAVAECGLGKKDAVRCKNFFGLGIAFWLFDRPLKDTLDWIDDKFKKKPEISEANALALKAGFHYADTVEMFTTHYRISKADLPSGKYRNITGNEALANGLIAASKVAKLPLFYASYPITPASDILHNLARRRHFDVKTFQAEDEIAAIGAAFGAAFNGNLGVTGTSGPGVVLKAEFMGLAVMTELPLILIDVQRGGPSTGLPTKTEQSDLLVSLFGRHGECPVAVLAARSPGDCFETVYEAVQIATRYMTPVIVLSDGYLANGSEPWRIPKAADLPPINVKFREDPDGFYPYLRDNETLSRPWAIPGTPGLEHRIGGIEKEHITGDISYDPDNHDLMVRIREEKIQRIAQDIPATRINGDPDADLLIVGWGSTYGTIRTAVNELNDRGTPVASIHLRHLSPLPSDLGDILSRYDKVLVPEINRGQLNTILRARYLVDTVSYNQVRGKPFRVGEIIDQVREIIKI